MSRNIILLTVQFVTRSLYNTFDKIFFLNTHTTILIFERKIYKTIHKCLYTRKNKKINNNELKKISDVLLRILILPNTEVLKQNKLR